MELDEAIAFINDRARDFINSNQKKFGENYDCYNAMQSVLAWDNIYDPRALEGDYSCKSDLEFRMVCQRRFWWFYTVLLGYLFCVDDACCWQ